MVVSGGVNTMAVLDSYTFAKDTTGAYGLTLTLRNVQPPANTISFTSQELLTSGVVNSSVFKVTNATGAVAYGQITVTGSSITFYPLNFLDWSTTYTVTISKAVKDATGRPLAADYTWSFKTTDVPKSSVDSVSPIGIDANPIKKSGRNQTLL